MRSVGWLTVSGQDWLTVVWLAIPVLSILAAGVPRLTRLATLVLLRKIRLAATGLEVVISFLQVFVAEHGRALIGESEEDLLGQGLAIVAAVILPILTFAFISLWQARPLYYPVQGPKVWGKRQPR